MKLYQSHKQKIYEKSSINGKWQHDKFDQFVSNLQSFEKKSQTNSNFQKQPQDNMQQNHHHQQFHEDKQQAQRKYQKYFNQQSYGENNRFQETKVKTPSSTELPEKQSYAFELKKENDDERLSTVSTTFSELIKSPFDDNSLFQVKFNLPNGIKIFKFYKFCDFELQMGEIQSALKLTNEQLLTFKLIFLQKFYLNEKWKANRLNINKPVKLLQLIQMELQNAAKEFIASKNQNKLKKLESIK